MRPRSGRLLPVLLGAGVVLLFFGALLPPDRVLLVRDIPMFHLPLRLVSSALARHGWPLWNPLISGGQPILSNPNYAAFYPPTWLALVLPAHYAMSLIVLLHASWAFAGAWRLARGLGCRVAVRAFAAIAFVASGAFVATINNFTLFCGLAWMPWVLHWGVLGLYSADRSERVRGGVLAGTAVAAQMLAGEPYSPTLGALALGCLALGEGAHWRAKIVRLSAMGVLAVCLAAAQLVPTLRHLADSPRSGSLSDEQTMTWSTRPDRFIEWVFPNLRGDPSRVDHGLYFGTGRHDRGAAYLHSIYVGQLVLVLAIAGLLGSGIPHRAAWTALIVLGVALALGRHDPLYAKLLVRLPPWSLLRYPEKFLLLSTTGLTFAGALGWEQVLARRDLGDRRAMRLPLIVAIGVLLLSMGLFGLPFVQPDVARALVVDDSMVGADVERYRLGFLGFEALVTCAVALGSLVILLLHRARRAREWWLAGAVLILVAADLYRTGQRMVPTMRAADLFTPPPFVATLPEPSARLWTDLLFAPSSPPQRFELEAVSSMPVTYTIGRAELQPYWANLWGTPYALNEDFDLMSTTAARHALEVFRTRTRLVEQGLNDLAMVYLGAWNACNLSRRRAPEALADEYQRTGVPPHRIRIVANPFCLDRFRFVPQAEMHPDLSSATAAAQAHGFAVARVEFLVAPEREPATRSYAPDASVTSLAENGATVDFDYASAESSLLVAAMTYDRNWRAAVDGERTDVFETALGQMAIEVPAGTHHVTLRYRDPWVVVGALVSLAAVAVALVLVRLSGRGSRAPAAPPPLPA